MATHAGLVLDISLFHLLLFDLLLRHLAFVGSCLWSTVCLQGSLQRFTRISCSQWHALRIVLLWLLLLLGCWHLLHLLSWSIVDSVRLGPGVSAWKIEFRYMHRWLRICRSWIKLLGCQCLGWQWVILCRWRLLSRRFLNLLIAILRTLHCEDADRNKQNK